MARDLLEVVEDHQALPASRNRVADAHDRLIAAKRDAETLCDGLEDGIQRSRPGAGAKPNTAGEPSEGAPSEAHAQACLASAADTEDRDEPCIATQAFRQF